MQKPNAYDDVKVGGSWTPPQVGGHKMVIKQVVETKNRNNKDMIVVCFDFDKTDIQPGFFTTEFKNDVRPEKKWPHAGTQYINVEDQEGKTSKSFKGFITSFEKSNNTEVVWGDKFAAQFKNKKIGGVYGEVENEYNGKVSMRHELRWFCSYGDAEGATVPEPKMLQQRPEKPNAEADADGFLAYNDDDGEIPWG